MSLLKQAIIKTEARMAITDHYAQTLDDVSVEGGRISDSQ